jgi:isocitrate/isopropylmalate dehydrogenase
MILSAAMMLRHLGEHEAGDALGAAIDRVLAAGDVRTRDLGGRASTTEMAAAVADALSSAGPLG